MYISTIYIIPSFASKNYVNNTRVKYSSVIIIVVLANDYKRLFVGVSFYYIGYDIVMIKHRTCNLYDDVIFTTIIRRFIIMYVPYAKITMRIHYTVIVRYLLSYVFKFSLRSSQYYTVYSYCIVYTFQIVI